MPKLETCESCCGTGQGPCNSCGDGPEECNCNCDDQDIPDCDVCDGTGDIEQDDEESE